jgi:uncharacterized protein (TIGR03435 family)
MLSRQETVCSSKWLRLRSRISLPGGGCTGGPGTSNPGTWSCTRITLAELVFTTYDLELYQFQPPDWMASYFAIVAKVLARTTKEQFRKMKQSLLEERFKLAFHWQPQEMNVYGLVVGKNGLKMRESAPNATAAEVEVSVVPQFKIGQDHYPVFPEGKAGLMGVYGHVRWRSSNVTMTDIVKVLRREVNSDVMDGTG